MATGRKDSDVRPGPNRYVSRIGAALHLGRYIEDYHRPVIVTGEASWQAYTRYVATATDPETGLRGEVPLTLVEHYDGSATIRNARQIAGRLPADTDAIVAIGGGKLSDTAKNVAELARTDIIVVPTLASTCSAYSTVSVNYDERHRYVSSPLHPRTSVLTLVDPALVATGPRRYLVGGIGDTLAKWYESAPIFDHAEHLGPFDLLARESARLIRAQLLEHGAAALQALDEGRVDVHLQTVVDTVIGLAGTVGGFGGAAARASGAHAVNDALSLIPGAAQVTHGEKVAYGILVQLAAQGLEDDIRALLPFYRRIGLPRSLGDMGLAPTPEERAAVLGFAAGNRMGFSAAVPGITAHDVGVAMDEVERIAAQDDAAHAGMAHDD
ncbi:glycerol dehydrogenase [Pseudoscardovia radai]|uniref:Glycerol dehydrogenase n=1 Tax=Pseudoscardovia radai TaxID=987066 RepID=A0A261EYA0_9BIFI|nr:iron-containing alcohol dehydrogenase family protein [Pseudoscardovia radai]OZG51840.1 glycerol dehydrogenase [Pseudoscardovia radai]